MSPIKRLRQPAAVGTVALAMLLAACGGSSVASSAPAATATAAPTAAAPTAEVTTAPATEAPTEEPTEAPTEEPTEEPTETPDETETAGGSPAASGVDPTVDLAIAEPYSLEPLSGGAGEMVAQSMQQALGSFGGFVEAGGRTVEQDGQPIGILLGFRFNIPGSEDMGLFEQVVASAGAAGEVTTETVDGVEVTLITSQGTTFAAHEQDELIVFSYGNTAEGSLAIVEALLAAR